MHTHNTIQTWSHTFTYQNNQEKSHVSRAMYLVTTARMYVHVHWQRLTRHLVHRPHGSIIEGHIISYDKLHAHKHNMHVQTIIAHTTYADKDRLTGIQTGCTSTHQYTYMYIHEHAYANTLVHTLRESSQLHVHMRHNTLLPTRARDQRLKCANNSNVAHFLILSSKSSRHDMTQQILKNSWWRNVWFCVEYYATLCNFPLKQTVAVETATN